MSSVKIAFGYCFVFGIVLLEVNSWTVDLKEVRKKYFEKIEKIQNVKQEKEDNYNGNVDEYVDKKYDLDGKDKYADKYSYHSYMEKKIHGIVHDGSVYLEGLRLSIERYTEMLENCTRFNSTMNRNNTLFNTTWTPNGMPSQNLNLSESFVQNMTDFLRNMPRGNLTSCPTVTRASEYVRRLAELAMHTTKKLQDIAYAKKYEYYKDYTLEENELILKLAWFLDRLAYITGYEPEPREFLSTNNSTSTTPPPQSLVNAPEDVKNAMMKCMDGESNEPATVRCRYPLPIPDFTMRLFNITDNPPLQLSPSSSDIREVVSSNPDSSSDQSSLELLIATDDRPPLFYPHLPTSKIVRIRAINDRLNDKGFLPLYTKIDLSNYPPMSAVKSVRKRSIDGNPLARVVNYYIKHKVWINSNSLLNDFDRIESLNDLVLKTTNKQFPDEFDVKNDLTVKSIHKRSVDERPMVKVIKYLVKNKVWESSNPMENSLQDLHPNSNFNDYEVKNEMAHTKSVQKRSLYKKSTILRLPENPKQDLSEHVKHKPGVNYNKDKLQAEKIIELIKKMRNKTVTFKRNVQKSDKNRQKRSLLYENMFLPRPSENPTKDLSYYVKNKEGTEYDSNLARAALVRANLQQIYQTGNIEVVRRFGSNYNPLVPAPFIAGFLKTMSDI